MTKRAVPVIRGSLCLMLVLLFAESAFAQYPGFTRLGSNDQYGMCYETASAKARPPACSATGNLLVDIGAIAAGSKVQITDGVDDALVSAGKALLVDASATTQPVSAVSLPLPTGASTAAKQPALGVAGTASLDVISVQGIAGMIKLLVTPDSVALPANQSVNAAQWNGATAVTGGMAGSVGVGGLAASNSPIVGNPVIVGAVYNSSELTPSSGNLNPLQTTSSAHLKVSHNDLGETTNSSAQGAAGAAVSTLIA